MNEINILKEELILKNQKLQQQRESCLKKYIEVNLNNNLLKIDQDLINYFKNIINDLNLTEAETKDINFLFQFYDTIKSLSIDLSTIYYEDSNIIKFKNTIHLISKKIIELKKIIISNIDLDINKNNLILDKIKKLNEMYDDNDINLELIYDIIVDLPIDDEKKTNIFKIFYNKQLEILKSLNKPQEIKFKITEKDKKLRLDIELLINNIKKLKAKIQSNDNNYTQTIDDSMKLMDLYNQVINLNNKLVNYINDKQTTWEGQEFSKEELEEELKKIYQEIKKELRRCLISFKKIYNKYEFNSSNTIEIEELEQVEDYPPIIYWFGNNDLISEDNIEIIDEILNDFDNYPEDNFYSDKFILALDLLKKQANFIDFKEKGIECKKIDTVVGISNATPFKELKLRQGSGGTARIYYTTVKTNSNKSYIVVLMIVNKHESYDKMNYKKIEVYLKGKIYSELPSLLDNPDNIAKFEELERIFLEKVKERIDKETKTGGSK